MSLMLKNFHQFFWVWELLRVEKIMNICGFSVNVYGVIALCTQVSSATSDSEVKTRRELH